MVMCAIDKTEYDVRSFDELLHEFSTLAALGFIKQRDNVTNL